MARIPPYAFLKWVGGKGRLAGRIIQRLPLHMDNYYEPFIGGGAVFLELARADRFKHAVLADSNPDLIAAWSSVRNNVEKLILALKNPEFEYKKEAYLKIRGQDATKMSELDRAARFIYLNRTCFNGLYRVNLSGRFNVPFGRYTDPIICDSENLRAVSKILQNTTIILGDFETACENAGAGDGAYLDPPYLPVSKTSKFTGYTDGGFSDESHKRLAKMFGKIGDAGCRVVLSNSAAPLALELYNAYDVDRYLGSRSIAGPAAWRKSVEEILVFHGPRTTVEEAI